MLTAECLYSTTMLKLSAQLNDEEFLGTAEDLAAFVSDKLASLGFGDRHRSTERLVRFYAYEGLLSKPERAPDDRRKANFGPLQVRQLLLARLLAERGWDLDRIRTLLHENREVSQLNKLIDELATPTEAEKLFFRTRGSEQVSLLLSEPDARSLKASMRGMSCSIEAMRDFSASAMPSPRPSRKTSYSTVQQLRQIADSEESPAEALRLMIKKRWRATIFPRPPVISSSSCWPSTRPPRGMNLRRKGGPNFAWPIGARPTSISTVASRPRRKNCNESWTILAKR